MIRPAKTQRTANRRIHYLALSKRLAVGLGNVTPQNAIRFYWLTVLILSGLCSRMESIGVAAAQEEPVSFSRQILPLLSDRCFHCHGPDEAVRESDVRLDLRETALGGDGNVEAIRPGNADASLLMERITSDDPDLVMPPPDSGREPLSPEQIELMKKWIDQGAVWGKHWSFEKPVRPMLPLARRSPVDSFIEHRLNKAGLRLSPVADKRTLIRRLSLDMTGLPPTLDEVDQFVSDRSSDAYEKLVDRLLNSPRFGERMAWPWLDAARYADSSGYQGDPERTMWPWRDWVIRSLNANMPFDQFTIEQLAGDLLVDATPEQRLATGFNRNHMHNSEGGRIPEETRVENVFDRTETVGTVWLGMTLQCARCHDHKYDPTSQVDYFRFFDFFNQTSEDGRNDRSKAVPPAMDYVSDAHPKKEPVKVMVMDTRKQPRETFMLVKGIYNSPTDKKVTAGVPAMLPPLNSRPDQRLSRLDLAQWIVSREHPLTARVTVNRFWQIFFGKGLVATPNDFGLQGKQPTHPELLDWLAVEFMDSGWDIKRLCKLLVMSDTYRQTAKATQFQLETDPENILWGRSPRYRLPSWMIRDQALAVSGLLQNGIGGPPVQPYQPPGVWSEATFGKKKYQEDQGEKLYRRSIYTFWRRIIGPTMFFDAARRQTCEVKPNRTNTPLHALTVLNDTTYVEAARVLAQKILENQNPKDPVATAETARSQLITAFETLCSRQPENSELKLLKETYVRIFSEYSRKPQQAESLLSVGNSPRNPALDPATHATLATMINMLLNLDEVLVRP